MTRALLGLLLLLLAGCEQTFRNMYDQPRYKPLAASPLWRDGRSSRPPVEGTEPHALGTFAGTTSGRLGLAEAPPFVPRVAGVRDDVRPPGSADTAAFRMPPITRAMLERGRQRFDAFCSPCHSIVGDGDGFVVRRGFPHPPSYHTDTLRGVSDAHIYAVITYGYGAMYPYASRLTPDDRIAVVAYVRALQLSQHAALDLVPPDQRAALEAKR